MITEETACVIVEPVQGEAGVIVPEDGFLRALRTRCDETGALLVFDEVQTGFGRTGRMFAFENSNPVLGHITTFGGHPLCCAAALASLKVLLREDWVAQAETKGQYMEYALRSHPAVREIRRSGLLLAVDLGREDYASRMLGLLLDEGAVSDYFLYNPTSFRIAPPLCISMEEADMAVNAVIRALDKL